MRELYVAQDRVALADLVARAFEFADHLPAPYSDTLRMEAAKYDGIVRNWNKGLPE
jgi:hypothetical protein